MKMKSLFGALIALGSIALMAVGVQAATTFSAGTVPGKTGTDVIVPVYVAADSGTTDTVNGYIMKIKYNPTEVTPVASATNDATDSQCFATVGDSFADGILVADVTSTSATENVLTVAWASASPVTVDDTVDIANTMASVDFKVAESVTNNSAIGVEVAALTKDGNTLADKLTYTENAGEITIDKGLLGDVNNDKAIDGVDVTLLKQYVINVITMTDLEALYPGAEYRSNVNEDGTIDGIDVTLLKQFVINVITSFK